MGGEGLFRGGSCRPGTSAIGQERSLRIALGAKDPTLYGDEMRSWFVVLVFATQFVSSAYGQEKTKPAAPDAASLPKTPVTSSDPVNYDYAWDQFDHRGKMIWDCRGMQSGAIVQPELCEFKPKTDSQWPDKKIPSSWKR